VDRSITGAAEFVRTNVMGTQVLLDVARERGAKRFLHISTDEVGGTMGPEEWFFEDSKLDPRSPYAASKTAAEHLVRAAGATFGMDYVITRTSNNYGPYQFPEKLLPLAICNALSGQPIPVYGDGLQIRDWVHVADNSKALQLALLQGKAGETYHIGGGSPQTNIDVLRTLLSMLCCHESLMKRVTDRLGHDRRYAVSYAKIERELGWRPEISFTTGLRATIHWYRQNQEWVKAVRNGEYLNYYKAQYGLNLPAGQVV
jgi:dTDP-glucose 4,6-dehydratase